MLAFAAARTHDDRFNTLTFMATQTRAQGASSLPWPPVEMLLSYSRSGRRAAGASHDRYRAIEQGALLRAVMALGGFIGRMNECTCSNSAVLFGDRSGE